MTVDERHFPFSLRAESREIPLGKLSQADRVLLADLPRLAALVSIPSAAPATLVFAVGATLFFTLGSEGR